MFLKEIYLLLLFIILSSLFRPSFGDFHYYFLLDTIKISKFTYASLMLIGNFCCLIGAVLFNTSFQRVETRTMVALGFVGTLVNNFLTYVFVMRWNLLWGISDNFFLFSTNMVFDVLLEIFAVLPIMVLFAKVTPKKIEGTMYAMLTGTLDFC